MKVLAKFWKPLGFGVRIRTRSGIRNGFVFAEVWTL